MRVSSAGRIRTALVALLTLAPAAADAQKTALARDDVLVSPAWVAARLGDPELVLLHVGEKAGYDAEHIPGARFLSSRDIHGGRAGPAQADQNALEMLSADSLRKALEALGIGDRTRVVVYFGKDWVTPATRVLFTLHYAGLGTRAVFLDGGLPAWKREGRPVTNAAPPAVRAASLTPRAPNPWIVDAAWVRERLGRPGVTVVDARGREFYDGPPHGEHRAGHVPGAVNISFDEITSDELLVRPDDQLATLFRARGVKAGDTVVVYCHIGQQATAVLLAARLLGHDVRLYDGSFEDWSRRKELPVQGKHAGASHEGR